MTAITELKNLYLAENRRRFPNFPEACRVVPKYSDRTANGLTKCIIDFMRLSGHQAERIAVTGRYIDHSKIVTDVIGRSRRIGSGKWIKSSMQPGTADISTIVCGHAVKIEVKMPGDRQFEAQKRYQEQVETAGGIYLIIGTFQEFFEWFNLLKCNDERI